MIKDNTIHIAERNRVTSRKLACKIDGNPDCLRGIKIPANDVVHQEYYSMRNISIAGLLLAFFVRVFH